MTPPSGSSRRCRWPDSSCACCSAAGWARAFTAAMGVGSVGLATVAAYSRLIPFLRGDHAPIVEKVSDWIAAGPFVVDASLRLDPLSALMIAFVTFVGFLIHVYSVGYMAHDETDAGLRAVLRVPEPLHVLDARPRAREQLPADVRRLGGRRPLLLPPDRLLLLRPRVRGDRRHARRSSSTASATSGSCSGCSGSSASSPASTSTRCSGPRRRPRKSRPT